MTFLDIFTLLSKGVGQTLLVTVICCLTGLAVGLLLTFIRKIKEQWFALWVDLFCYVFRGIPVLVLLFLVYFGLPTVGMRCSPLLAMMLSLGMITAAYLAEVFRGALMSVDPQEILAAESMGFSKIQIFYFIELPQMVRFSIPGMLNEFTSVLKYSPFAYTVGIPEITKQAISIVATTLQGVEVYLAIGVLYFAIYRGFLTFFSVIERYFYIPGFNKSL